ncbi:BPTD_2524 family lipoprotein [Bordetella holmesii]|nr:hypothetical protein [Bordetella holmesii]AMD48057.1 hypothetical protein F783_003840 [Bordetella holmesii F627]KCV07536.1 putative lipoprotein [Bordetella holmesii CDC-H629-BH]MBO1240889.1 hypothetical protein [Bordetella holmesii]MBO1244386.1 hypothetical protein [Bordetella holmesii]MBO1247521.1 hypothetical protein [Bordetella holmesii]
MRQWMGLAAIAVVLSGCASKGLQERDVAGVSETFVVNADPMAALRRASEYVRVCHEVRAHPYGVVYAGKRSVGDRGLPNEILVHKETEPAKILERINTQPAEFANQAQVTVTVLAEGVWDTAEIAAARRSIESSTPVCRAQQ